MGADRILAFDCHEARLAVAREQGATDGGLVDILPPDVRGPSWACLGSDRSKADAIKISTLILMAWSSRAFVAGHVRAGRVEEARVRRFILAVKSALATRHREVTKSLSQRKVTRPLWSTPGAGDRGHHSGRVPGDHPNGPVDCLYGGRSDESNTQRGEMWRRLAGPSRRARYHPREGRDVHAIWRHGTPTPTSVRRVWAWVCPRIRYMQESLTSAECTGSVGNKKPRKTLILRGFSDYFGLRRNNCWCPGEDSNLHGVATART
jgi:hypothetical protein